MNELTDLVEQLTRPHTIAVTRHGELIGHRTQKPLLDLLAAASVPSISATQRGTALGPRLAFDPAASELYTDIRRRIRGWAIDAGVPKHWVLATGQPIDWRDATDLLTAWHTRALHRNPATYTPTLAGWILQITDLIVDPPRRIALDAPCPHCRNRWSEIVIDDSDPRNPMTERVDALRVIIRDPATASETLCRNCGARWTGLDGAEHLADLLRQRAAS